MENENLLERLKLEGYTNIKFIEGFEYCGLRRFMFTTGLCFGIGKNGYLGRWCYTNHADAKEALRLLNKPEDPTGPWIKYKGIGGERSNPNLKKEP